MYVDKMSVDKCPQTSYIRDICRRNVCNLKNVFIILSKEKTEHHNSILKVSKFQNFRYKKKFHFPEWRLMVVKFELKYDPIEINRILNLLEVKI